MVTVLPPKASAYLPIDTVDSPHTGLQLSTSVTHLLVPMLAEQDITTGPVSDELQSVASL